MISRHKFLSELEGEGGVSEPDPLLEIKHIHRMIDESAERAKRLHRKEVMNSESSSEYPCDL